MTELSPEVNGDSGASPSIGDYDYQDFGDIDDAERCGAVFVSEGRPYSCTKPPHPTDEGHGLSEPPGYACNPSEDGYP